MGNETQDISLLALRIENPVVAKIPFDSVPNFLMELALDTPDEDAVQDYRLLGSSASRSLSTRGARKHPPPAQDPVEISLSFTIIPEKSSSAAP